MICRRGLIFVILVILLSLPVRAMEFSAPVAPESAEEFLRGMEKVCALAPENVTVHTLSLKKGSALKERVSRLTEGEVGQKQHGARVVHRRRRL